MQLIPNCFMHSSAFITSFCVAVKLSITNSDEYEMSSNLFTLTATEAFTSENITKSVFNKKIKSS